MGGGYALVNNGYALWLHEKSYTGLVDYKIHCFNGIPKIVLVCCNRYNDNDFSEDFFTVDWNRIDVKRPNVRNNPFLIKKPEGLYEMLEISKRLSKGIPFLRIDFYSIGGSVYFGELTFYPSSGFVGFIPNNYDNKIGEMIELFND